MTEEQSNKETAPKNSLEHDDGSRKSLAGALLWLTLGILVVPVFDFLLFREEGIFTSSAKNNGRLSTVTRCWRSRNSNFSESLGCSGRSSSELSSQQQHPLRFSIPEQCINGSVWSGQWNLNPNISKPGSKNPADIDMAQRYHSEVETACNMTDLLKLSAKEVISGHENNDVTEDSVVERFKGLHGQTLLQIGTSVDNRNLRFGCPVFGVNREVATDNGVSISTCVIPLINFTIAYTFNDALTMVNTPIDSQEEQLKKVDELYSTISSSPPKYVLLSGIEWDFKWYKDNKQDIDWNYTYSMLEKKATLFRSHYADATALFLRTQPFLIGSTGSLAPEPSFNKYNSLFREVVQNLRLKNKKNDPCNSVHLADMAKLMLYNGTADWSDGVHPAGWVSMQYLNILLNVISLLGDSCGP